MIETSQAIAAVKREVQLSEWQRQKQARQEQGVTVDEWCIRLGISKGTYYHRLIKVREYMCQRMGATERQERLKPILDGLFAWLSELTVSGGTKLAKAVQYCLNEKPYLYRCLEDGIIPVDNNRAENAIRPFVVGRKNWLFANSVKGAQSSAIIYSLAATATANGLNVEEYFTRLFRSDASLPWV